MIEQDARVVTVGPGWVWVETARRSACASCSAASGCGTSVVARLFGERVNRFQISDRIGVQIGDRVVIGIADGALTRAALLAYLLPLFALMLTAFGAQSAGAGEGASALFGVLGLGLGLWGTGRLTGGALGRVRFRPVLLRRAEPRAIAVAVPSPADAANH